MENQPSKSWMFTLNNYTEGDVQRYKDMTFNYLVLGYEVGESGTRHIQGYVIFKRAYRLSQLKKLDPRAHWDLPHTVDPENYCMKGGDYEQIDNRAQGKRNDLKTACEVVKTHGLDRMIDELPHMYVKYHSGFDKLVQRKGPRTEKPIVIWIYGETGVGKTRCVFEREPNIWISGKNLRWWQGYCNQEAVLFDDFRSDFCTYHELLRILDRYPYQVEVKGGSVEFTSKRIYITSPYSPTDCYLTVEDKDQLTRRIDGIIWGRDYEQIKTHISEVLDDMVLLED